jgi:WXG100 family type VII secretion target
MTVPGVNFDATPDQIDDVGTKCINTSTDLNGELATLRGYVAELGAAWFGVASVAFANLMLEYDTKAQQLTAALADIGNGLHLNAANYRLGEQTNTTVITNVTV